MTRTREIAGSLSILALGLLMMALVVSDLRIWSGGEPAAGFFPAVIAVAIILLSSTIALTAVLKPPAVDDIAPAPRSGLAKVGAYVVATALLALLFDRLGFVISSFAFIFLLLLLVERQGAALAMAVAAGAIAIAYCVFVLFLKVPLPSIGVGPL